MRFGLVCLLFVSVQPLYAGMPEGRKNYQKHCLQCHESEAGSWSSRESRAFADYVIRTPDYELIERLKRGGRLCPAYAVLLTDEEIEDVASYIRTLR